MQAVIISANIIKIKLLIIALSYNVTSSTMVNHFTMIQGHSRIKASYKKEVQKIRMQNLNKTI